MKKYLAYLILISIPCLFLCTVCQDYIHTGIEGQWQLQTISSDGQTQEVDTVYYSFKKGVFRLLIADTPTESRIVFGKFVETDNRLDIELIYSDNPDDILRVGWDQQTQRSFQILEHTGLKLVLSYENQTFTFRKY